MSKEEKSLTALAVVGASMLVLVSIAVITVCIKRKTSEKAPIPV